MDVNFEHSDVPLDFSTCQNCAPVRKVKIKQKSDCGRIQIHVANENSSNQTSKHSVCGPVRTTIIDLDINTRCTVVKDITPCNLKA